AARCYPANRWVLDSAVGVLVHSRYAIAQAETFYGPAYQRRLSHIPFPCPAPRASDRAGARLRLGLPEDDFIVCCFGFLAASKLNHLLIQAWVEAGLASSGGADRKSTRLNSSHVKISYAVFCLKKKNNTPALR